MEEVPQMARARKSWHEKLEKPVAGLPKVVDVPDQWVKTMGGRRVLVPTPRMVDDLLRTVPRQKLITIGQIRRRLAQPSQADSAGGRPRHRLRHRQETAARGGFREFAGVSASKADSHE